MLRDFGSRDPAFSKIVKEVRQRLVDIALASQNTYTTVISNKLKGRGITHFLFFNIKAIFNIKSQ
jgi:hypothetical protein